MSKKYYRPKTKIEKYFLHIFLILEKMFKMKRKNIYKFISVGN